MLRQFSRVAAAGLLTAALTFVLTNDARAQCLAPNGDAVACRGIDYGNPDLFYNYYVDSTCSQTGAQLYISPQPVPPVVGHTYITYQPFYPHEFLYPHHHYYYRYYDGGRGMTRAAAIYYNPPVRNAAHYVYRQLRIPR